MTSKYILYRFYYHYFGCEATIKFYKNFKGFLFNVLHNDAFDIDFNNLRKYIIKKND